MIEHIINCLKYTIFWIVVLYTYPKISKPFFRGLHQIYSKTIKPHTNKTIFIFTFIITLFIGGNIAFFALEGIGLMSLWPYQMTLLTLVLGYGTYKNYKIRYPSPLNYTLQQFLKKHRLDAVEVVKQ